MNRLALSLLPKRTLTTLIAAFARSKASRVVIPWYMRHYQIGLEDAEKSIGEFDSLMDFFCRTLKKGARAIANATIISPVDGRVSELGAIHAGQVFQAKGCTYSIEALLGDASLAESFQDGVYITLYLSPRDYHRIHMPIEGYIHSWRYIPGRLFPVNDHGVRLISGLYTKNERVVTGIETPWGRMLFVKVGATIVGSVQTVYGASSPPTFSRARRRFAQGAGGGYFLRGDEIGHFEFGSTVILLFEPGMVDSFCVQKGQFVQMGEALVR